MTRAPRTLRASIVRSTSLVTAVALAAMIGTVMLVLAGLNRTNVDARLTDQLSAITSTLTVDANGAVTSLETPDDAIDDTTWVFDSRDRLVEGPRAGRRVNAYVSSLSGVTSRQRSEKFDRSFLAAPVTLEDKTQAVVVVATSTEPFEQTRIIVLIGLLAVGAAVTIGSAAMAAWTVRRTLVPVESMAARAEDWSEQELDTRFVGSETGDEFARLGHTLNVLLDRVAGAFRSEQRLTSELAHELRTPLTAIRGEAELTLMDAPSPANAERAAHIVQMVDRMSATITSLLDLARGTSHHHGGQARVADVVGSVADVGTDGGRVRIDVTGVGDDELPVPLALAARALAPLVENAGHHARTTVTISTRTDERSVQILVSDDGSGMAGDDLDALFESGHRGPTSSGAGLGLALSRRVARALGGDVSVESPADPTTFVVTLPRF